MPQLYYTPPTDEAFNEVKNMAMSMWLTMGDEPSYSLDKIKRIQDLPNISDHFMYMVAMFSLNNQRKLSAHLTEETRKAVCERMIDGGQPDWANPFL